MEADVKKKLSERAVIVIHPEMEMDLMNAIGEKRRFQTYQLILPRMVGKSIDEPTGSPKERDEVKAELLDYVKATLLDDVEMMSIEKFNRLKAEELAELQQQKSDLLK